MSVRRQALATTMLTSLAAFGSSAMPLSAADLYPKFPVVMPQPYQPAVDGVNWKLGGLAGSLARNSIYGGTGSISVPLADRFGFQFDAAGGSYDSRAFMAGGAHLFWRDPNRGLLGVYASGTRWDRAGGVNVGQVAGEVEVYFGQWTLQGIAGVEGGNTKSEIISNFIDTYEVKTRFFDKVNLAYYLNDNWKAFVGHRYLGGKNALALGSEYAFRVNGPVMGALFIEARVGEDDYKGLWGGLRFYGGYKDKTLIQRQRQDDPIDWNPESLFSIVKSTTAVPVVNNTPPPCTPFPECNF